MKAKKKRNRPQDISQARSEITVDCDAEIDKVEHDKSERPLVESREDSRIDRSSKDDEADQ